MIRSLDFCIGFITTSLIIGFAVSLWYKVIKDYKYNKNREGTINNPTTILDWFVWGTILLPTVTMTSLPIYIIYKFLNYYFN